MLNNFIYAKTKALFLEKLNAGEVLDEAIVFIEDTKEIWNHGTYFAEDYIVNTDEELGVLDVPLGTIASVVKERYDDVKAFGELDFGTVIKEIVIKDENIPNIDFTQYTFDNRQYRVSFSDLKGVIISMFISAINSEGTPCIKISMYHPANDFISIYTDSFEINEDRWNELNSTFTSGDWFYSRSEGDSSLANLFNELIHCVFTIPSKVQTYIKSEKGLDLPTVTYRKFSDFGTRANLFPKEERIVKNFSVVGDVFEGGVINFETIDGTLIQIFGNVNTGGSYIWNISYDNTENKILTESELQLFNELLNSTTVYYIGVAGSSGFTSQIDTFVVADFPPIYGLVELKTWSKVYTQQDALTDSEIDDILNEVFNNSYYYYGEDGIGTFDLDEDSVIDQTNIESDETDTQS